MPNLTRYFVGMAWFCVLAAVGIPLLTASVERIPNLTSFWISASIDFIFGLVLGWLNLSLFPERKARWVIDGIVILMALGLLWLIHYLIVHLIGNPSKPIGPTVVFALMAGQHFRLLRVVKLGIQSAGGMGEARQPKPESP
jgi:hypothetical protein